MREGTARPPVRLTPPPGEDANEAQWYYRWRTFDKRAAPLIGQPCILLSERDFRALLAERRSQCERCGPLLMGSAGRQLARPAGRLTTSRNTLAETNAYLQMVLFDLLEQVEAFIAMNGEADFWTGPARALRHELQGAEIPSHLLDAVDKLRAKQLSTPPRQGA